MAQKVTIDGNYIFFEDTETGKKRTGACKDVKVYPVEGSNVLYEVTGLRGENAFQVTTDSGGLEDSEGAVFNNTTWIAFYTDNTGNFNSGGATPQNQFVMYVADQDATGFIGTNVRKNDFADNFFEFTYQGSARFAISNFDPSIHKMEIVVHRKGYDAVYDNAGSFLETYDATDFSPSEGAFNSGGFITITEYPII